MMRIPGWNARRLVAIGVAVLIGAFDAGAVARLVEQRADGVELVGESRQVSWVDYDNDGKVDLFVAFRDRPNVLFRNDGDRFTDVSKEMGIDDPRKTVGAVWFDMDGDGKLDLFVANQDGDTNGFYRNEGARFVDVAPQLGMDGAGRPLVYGGVGPAVG